MTAAASYEEQLVIGRDVDIHALQKFSLRTAERTQDGIFGAGGHPRDVQDHYGVIGRGDQQLSIVS